MEATDDKSTDLKYEVFTLNGDAITTTAAPVFAPPITSGSHTDETTLTIDGTETFDSSLSYKVTATLTLTTSTPVTEVVYHLATTDAEVLTPTITADGTNTEFGKSVTGTMTTPTPTTKTPEPILPIVNSMLYKTNKQKTPIGTTTP